MISVNLVIDLVFNKIKTFDDFVFRSRTTTPTTPTSPQLYSSNRTASSERSSSKKSRSMPKEGSMSDNQSTYDNPTIIDNTEQKSVIDNEISELCAKLPPIDKKALFAWKTSYIHDPVKCTCKLIESDNNDGFQTKCDFDENNGGSSSNNENVPKMLSDCDKLSSEMPIENRPHELNDDLFTKSMQQTNFNSTVATSTSISISSSLNRAEPDTMIDVPIKKPTIKSIFDLDYEDDDPITFKLNHNNNINLNTKENKLSNNRDSNISDKSCDELFLNEKNKKEDDDDDDNNKDSTIGQSKNTSKSNFQTVESGQSELEKDADDGIFQNKMNANNLNNIASMHAPNANAIPPKSIRDGSITLNAPIDLNQFAFQSRFRVEEDIDCKAKQLYITSKQLITEYHVEKLHTSYIPNINGNWDDSKAEDDSSVNMNINGCENDEKPSQMICDEEDPSSIRTNIETSTATTSSIDDIKKSLNLEPDEVFEIESRLTEASIGLYDRVVPLCNHINMDRLPKNLSCANLDFDLDDEVEPHIFIASIQVKKEAEIEPTTTSLSSPSQLEKNSTKSVANNTALITDDPLETGIHLKFPIYDCDNDIDCKR